MEDQQQQQQRTQRGNGDAVYGLGVIGAVVWFWRQSERPEEKVAAVFKGLLWPALLVYEAFNALHR